MIWKCILEKSWKCIQLTVYPGDDMSACSKMSRKWIQLTVYPGDDLNVYSKMSWKCIQLTVYPGDDLKVYSKEDLKVYSWDAAEDSSALYQITSDKWRRGYGRENTTYVPPYYSFLFVFFSFFFGKGTSFFNFSSPPSQGEENIQCVYGKENKYQVQ